MLSQQAEPTTDHRQHLSSGAPGAVLVSSVEAGAEHQSGSRLRYDEYVQTSGVMPLEPDGEPHALADCDEEVGPLLGVYEDNELVGTVRLRPMRTSYV